MDGVLAQASSGLDSLTKRLATVAQNVANANTADYAVETLQVSSAVAGGQGSGVRTGVAVRTMDAALQNSLLSVDGKVAGGALTQSALAGIDAASGAPGSGQDLASLVGALRDGFSQLDADPSNETQQRQVVALAGSVARGLNALGSSVSSARQAVQDGLVQDVAAANVALGAVGQLSDQIVAARSRGESTADLEDKRDTAIRTATELTGAAFLPQSDGGLLAISGGTVLPLHSATGPLAIGSATLAPDTPAGAVPLLTVNGVAAPISGGRIGAALNLRDGVLPGLQAGLDGFAQALTAGFAGVGLPLFTDGSGTVPAAGTGGYAQTIQVNPAVSATPSMVRDGTATAGAAGNTSVIDAVLGQVLQTGAGTISGQAAALVANAAALTSAAGTQLSTDQAVQASLQTKLNAGTGVSVDTEMANMVQLQNSYGANARVISAVQTLWTQLLAAVQ